jgi:hypothetical protein
MASEFSHAIVALAMGKAFQNKELSWRELLVVRSVRSCRTWM